MEKFSLDKYLENPSRKVVTRDGREAIIVCTNADDKFPVVAKIQGWDAPFVELFNRDGIHSFDWDECIFDLFFADKEELTEFDYAVLSIISDHNSHTDSIEAFAKRSSKKLLDLARKEILKDLPKWKKITEEKQNYLAYGYLSHDGYYLSIQELKDKLPKEE